MATQESETTTTSTKRSKRATRTTNAKKERSKPYFNVADGIVSFDGATYSLIGTSRDTYTMLALSGLLLLLRRSKKHRRDGLYKQLISGSYWNKEPKYPIVVQAIARITEEKPAIVAERWRKLDRKAKAKYMRDAQVRAIIAELNLELAKDDQLSDFSEFKQSSS